LAEKPPVARTTPRRARTATDLPSRSTMTPRTAPSSMISRSIGASRHNSTPPSMAERSSRAARALPMVSRAPRGRLIRSTA
jgi:hypothetical protein